MADDEIHLWDYEILCLEDGEIAFDVACCCCLWPDCCSEFFFSEYNSLYVRITTDDDDYICTGGGLVDTIYGLAYDVGGWLYADASTYSGSGVEVESGGGWWIKLECLSEGETNGTAEFRISFQLAPGLMCCASVSDSIDITEDCFPFGYSIHFDWSDTCPDYYGGGMTLTFGRAACSSPPDGCPCAFLNVCSPMGLIARIDAGGACVAIDGLEAIMECTSGCVWSTDGCVCFDVEEDCCFRLELEGAAATNRYCDYTLRIYDCADNLIYEAAAVSGAPNPFTLRFEGITFPAPCCDDEEVAIDIVYGGY